MQDCQMPEHDYNHLARKLDRDEGGDYTTASRISSTRLDRMRGTLFTAPCPSPSLSSNQTQKLEVLRAT